MENTLKRFAVGSHALFLAIVILLIASSIALAQETQLQPGVYLTEHGWGTLTIEKDSGDRLSFTILTVGSNSHTCSLDGKITRGKSFLESGEKDRPCVVTFAPQGRNIKVTGSNPECRFYCGMRASFEALYMKPPKNCAPIARQKARNDFKRLYNKKSYTQARDKLETLLSNCSEFIGWIEGGWLRNDLAITLYKLRDFEGCRKTLAGFSADIAKTEEQLREDYPPSDADSYIPVVKAARTNLKLCDEGKR
jgi:hypothetical protein